MAISYSWRCQLVLTVVVLLLSLGSSGLSLAETPVRRLAVLEFQGLKLEAEVLSTFSDAVRGGAVEGLQTSNTKVITHENMMVLLREMGKTDCVEGDCEVETARSIGADFVISGLVVHIENSYVVTLKLHETKDGGLLATDTVQTPTQLEILSQLRDHGQALVAKKILPLSPSVRDVPSPRLASEPRPIQATQTPSVAVAPMVAEKRVPVVVTVADMSPKKPPVDNSPSSGWRTAGVLTMIAGAGGVAGGVYFGLHAKSISDELSSSKTFSASKDDEGKLSNTLQYVGYGVGGAALAGGLLMCLLGNGESKVSFAPLLTTQYVGLALQMPVR